MLAMRRRLARDATNTGTEDLSSVIGRFLPDGAKVDSLRVERDMRDTTIVSCRYSLDNFGMKSGDFMRLDFSDWCDNRVLSAFESQSRTYDVMLPFPDTRSSEFRIEIPAGYAVVQRPRDATNENRSFSYRRSCTGEDPVLVLKRVFSVTVPTVEALDYTPTRSIVEEIQKSDKEQFVLKRSS